MDGGGGERGGGDVRTGGGEQRPLLQTPPDGAARGSVAGVTPLGSLGGLDRIGLGVAGTRPTKETPVKIHA